MNAEIHQLRPKPTTINWMCSACGVDAGCNCGAPLMSKAQRAKEAIEANPQKSNRAIAEDVGVSEGTVRTARKATAQDYAVDDEPRIGLDGKQRRMPIRRAVEEEGEEIQPATPEERRTSFLLFANEAMAWAEYSGPVDDGVLRAAIATKEAWCRLVDQLEGNS